MRLLLVTHEHPPIPGGAGVGIAHLARCLAGRGHDVTVLTAGGGSGSSAEEGVAVERIACGFRPGRHVGPRLWLRFLLRSPARIRALAHQEPFDVVASFFPIVAGLAVLRSGWRGPHVTTFVGADLHDPTRRWVAADVNPLVRWLTGRVLRRAAAVTAGSSDMMSRLESVFPGRPARRVSLGVPPLEAPPVSRRELGLSDDALVVVSVCRLVRRKRLDVLLDAAGGLEIPLQVVLVGDGPAAGELRARASRPDLEGKVRFTGAVDEERKAALMAAADVFCLPSAHEAFGLAIVEALGLGTPVLTTASGGQGDIVRQGVEGFLLPVGDVEALRSCLARLRDEPETLARMSAAAVERARRFTPDATADGFLDVFRDAGVSC